MIQSSTSVTWEQVQAEFQAIWGYSTFRPPQAEIIQCLLAQKDALIVLPTGGGKSICFQLPALLQSGLTLVISPLIALMENQVQELHQRHGRFRRQVALLHNELPAGQRRQTLHTLERGELRLLYLSPETLLSQAVWQRLCHPHLAINGLILDEAHCLVQWGETFRPAYYRLGAVRSALLKHKPAASRMGIAAFTATADPDAQRTISQILRLNQPECFRVNPYRSNLDLAVQTVWSPRQRRQVLLKLAHTHRGKSGLVYVRSRRDSEELADWLNQRGFETAAYHAGLGSESRRQIEALWLSNRLEFVICTCAFGMGINKPDVRWIAHYNPPSLLSEYVQEVGRAGRDGKPAVALTLISEPSGWFDNSDRQRWQFFASQAQQQVRLAQHLAKKLPPQGTVDAVSRQFKDGAIALSLLHKQGGLNWLDPFHYRIQSGKNSSNSHQSNLQASQQMCSFLTSRQCRWQTLLLAFGFTQEGRDWRCGHCDRCRKS